PPHPGVGGGGGDPGGRGQPAAAAVSLLAPGQDRRGPPRTGRARPARALSGGVMGRAGDRRGGSPSPDWRGLQGVIDGEVVLPGSPGYEAARRPAIALFEGTRPQAVVRCKTPDDVAATVALARRSGLPAAVRSGGHCFAGRSSTEGIVIDVTPMRSVSVGEGGGAGGSGARVG